MATQPNNPIVRVAQQDTILPSTQLTNKILPSTSVINVGYDANELVAAENLNYIFDNFGEWLTYLKGVGDSQIGAGDGLQTTPNSISGGQVLSVDNTVVRQTRTITAGDGITGGGNLGADRELRLGTPSSVGVTSTNSVSENSHTHKLVLDNNNISIMTGSILNGETIPLPAGYLESQCSWFVSFDDINVNSGGWDIPEDGTFVHLKSECYTTGRVVTAVLRVFNQGSGGLINRGSSANYIIIGVK